MNDLVFLFAVHNHQPVGNFDHVFRAAFEDCYRPLLETLATRPGFRFALHFSGPLWPAETAAYLMAQPWVHIAGNHDRALLTSSPERLIASDAYALPRLSNTALDWLRDLPARVVLSEGLFACHGSPRSDTEYLLETVERGRGRTATAGEIAERVGSVDAEIVLCGHSHIPGMFRSPAGYTHLFQIVFSKGNVTDPWTVLNAGLPLSVAVTCTSYTLSRPASVGVS